VSTLKRSHAWPMVTSIWLSENSFFLGTLSSWLWLAKALSDQPFVVLSLTCLDCQHAMYLLKSEPRKKYMIEFASLTGHSDVSCHM
jgi:hypothetical protein